MNYTTSKHSPPESTSSVIPIEGFLSKDDYDSFINLKNTFSSQACRNCRNRRVQSFIEILTAIHWFINKTKEDSWKRSLICGLCWYKNYLCVNIRQMSYLLEKCKSSINGSLQRLFLIVLKNKQQSVEIILEAIPYLKTHKNLLKMWSVRQYYMQSHMYSSPIASNYMQNFQINPFPFYNSNITPTQSLLIKKYKLPDIKYDDKLDDNDEIQIQKSAKKDENKTNIIDAFDLFKDVNSSEGVFD